MAGIAGGRFWCRRTGWSGRRSLSGICRREAVGRRKPAKNRARAAVASFCGFLRHERSRRSRTAAIRGARGIHRRCAPGQATYAYRRKRMVAALVSRDEGGPRMPKSSGNSLSFFAKIVDGRFDLWQKRLRISWRNLHALLLHHRRWGRFREVKKWQSAATIEALRPAMVPDPNLHLRPTLRRSAGRRAGRWASNG